MVAILIAFVGATTLVFWIQHQVHKRFKPDAAPDINRMLLNALILAGGLTFLAQVTAG